MQNSSSLLERAYRIVQAAVTSTQGRSFNTNQNRRNVKDILGNFTSSQIHKLQEYAYETYREKMLSDVSLQGKKELNELCVYVARQSLNQHYVQAGKKIVEELSNLDSYEKAIDLLKYVYWIHDVVSNLYENVDEASLQNLMDVLRGKSFEDFLRLIPQLKLNHERY